MVVSRGLLEVFEGLRGPVEVRSLTKVTGPTPDLRPYDFGCPPRFPPVPPPVDTVQSSDGPLVQWTGPLRTPGVVCSDSTPPRTVARQLLVDQQIQLHFTGGVTLRKTCKGRVPQTPSIRQWPLHRLRVLLVLSGPVHPPEPLRRGCTPGEGCGAPDVSEGRRRPALGLRPSIDPFPYGYRQYRVIVGTSEVGRGCLIL